MPIHIWVYLEGDGKALESGSTTAVATVVAALRVLAQTELPSGIIAAWNNGKVNMISNVLSYYLSDRDFNWT